MWTWKLFFMSNALVKTAMVYIGMLAMGGNSKEMNSHKSKKTEEEKYQANPTSPKLKKQKGIWFC